MSDLKLSSQAQDFGSAQSSPPDFSEPAPVKKKGGCGCFLIGCVTIILLIITPVIGGFVYLAMMDTKDWASVFINSATSDFSTGFIRGVIKEADNLNDEQKTQALKYFDEFVKNYESLSAADKTSLEENIGKLLQKFQSGDYSDQTKLETTPEAVEIMKLLKIPALGNSVTDSTPPPTTPTTTPTVPVPVNGQPDPYSFDLPTTTAAPTPTTTTPSSNPTQFDF